MKKIKAIYGTKTLIRAKCQNPDCYGCWAFVLDGRMACCGWQNEAEIDGVKRMTQAEPKRRLPSLKDRFLQIRAQDNRCFYCGLQFKSLTKNRYRKKYYRLKLEWDHISPFVWGQNNNPTNFVAACQICNRLKGAKIFPTREVAIKYVLQKRKRLGYAEFEEMSEPRMPERIFAEQEGPEILFSGVQVVRMEEISPHKDAGLSIDKWSGKVSQCEQEDDLASHEKRHNSVILTSKRSRQKTNKTNCYSGHRKAYVKPGFRIKPKAICFMCGLPFGSNRFWQEFCSATCRGRYWRRMRDARLAGKHLAEMWEARRKRELGLIALAAKWLEKQDRRESLIRIPARPPRLLLRAPPPSSRP